MRRTALVAVLLLAVLADPATAGERNQPPPPYSPPVPGALVDDWRPPAEKWGAGNRGVDFAADPGEAVVAAADGEVVFAGTVAGTRHVVVLHGDGLRTSYSFLAAVAVRRGDRVVAGERVGEAGGPVHFGVRAGDVYVDPLTVLGAGPSRVHLVADDDRRPAPVAEERGTLERLLRRSGRLVAGVTATAGAWARRQVVRQVDRARVIGTYLGEHNPITVFVGLAEAGYRAYTRDCTPADAPVPPRPPGRRLLVRVAGLGSHTGTGAHATQAGDIEDLDGAALGYADADDVQFSYAGGTTDERPYDGVDTYAPIRESGARLGALLDRLADDHPGVPIDVVAHSMGGLVTRAALTTTSAPVEHVVTIGTPHDGADLATLGQTLRTTTVGDAAIAAAGGVDAVPIDPDAASVHDLAEGSDFLDWLDDDPLPSGVRFTSIAGRHDWVVPVPRAHLDGAANVVVDPAAVANEHGALPGSPEVAWAAALALAGAPPPCEGVLDAVADRAFGEAFALAADTGGLAAARALP